MFCRMAQTGQSSEHSCSEPLSSGGLTLEISDITRKKVYDLFTSSNILIDMFNILLELVNSETYCYLHLLVSLIFSCASSLFLRLLCSYHLFAFLYVFLNLKK